MVESQVLPVRPDPNTQTMFSALIPSASPSLLVSLALSAAIS